MHITLEQWKALDDAKKAALKALAAYESVLANVTLSHSSNGPEKALLLDIVRTVDDAVNALMTKDVTPVNEWLGGDASRWREPHCVPIREYLDDWHVEYATYNRLVGEATWTAYCQPDQAGNLHVAYYSSRQEAVAAAKGFYRRQGLNCRVVSRDCVVAHIENGIAVSN